MLGWECPLRSITGIPGPGCYLTRATSAALNGDLQMAFEFHLFGPVAATVLVAWSFMALRKRRLVPVQRSGPFLPLGVSGLMAYWLLRVVLSYGFGVIGAPGFPAPD